VDWLALEFPPAVAADRAAGEAGVSFFFSSFFMLAEAKNQPLKMKLKNKILIHYFSTKAAEFK